MKPTLAFRCRASVACRPAILTGVALSVARDFYCDSVFCHVHDLIDDLDSSCYTRYKHNLKILARTVIMYI